MAPHQQSQTFKCSQRARKMAITKRMTAYNIGAAGQTKHIHATARQSSCQENCSVAVCTRFSHRFLSLSHVQSTQQKAWYTHIDFNSVQGSSFTQSTNRFDLTRVRLLYKLILNRLCWFQAQDKTTPDHNIKTKGPESKTTAMKLDYT